MTQQPPTMHDDVAQQLDNAIERINDGEDEPSRYDDLADLLDNDLATTFPFTLYGNEYTVLAFPETGYRNNSKRIRSFLFDSEVDLEAIDGDRSLRDLNAIHQQYIKDADLLEDEPTEDTAHLVATTLGYFTRKLIDGRGYTYRNPRHDDPTITEA